MKIDEYGRVHYASNDLFELLYQGEIIDNLISYGEDIKQYNDLCKTNDKLEFLLPETPSIDISPTVYHRNRQKSWVYPANYDKIDLWGILAERCKTDEELERLHEEKAEYEKRDLVSLLRLMMYLVDNFRERNIVWGIGRGSSVASFVLYLIGITRINPLKFGLKIEEFLKN